MNYVNIKIHIYSTRVENKFYSQTYTDMKEIYEYNIIN